MAITFLPQNRKQKYFLFALGVVALGGLGAVWYQFIREEPSLRSQLLPPPRNVQIDFTVFQTPAFLELGDPRPRIPLLLPGEVGKPNPFTQTQ